MADRWVTIVDYGIGNLRSLEKALESVGVRVQRTDAPEVILRSERLIVPGVGAFGACASELRRRGLVDPIRAYAATGRPLLGVCVGMQLLFERSDELGIHEGLGLLDGDVTRFSFRADDLPGVDVRRLKVPHMGWNSVQTTRPSPLLDGLSPVPYFYFVHSYHVRPVSAADTCGECEYGKPFAAIVQRENVFGVQFHPEKSQRNGLVILNNFSYMTADSSGLTSSEHVSTTAPDAEPVVLR